MQGEILSLPILPVSHLFLAPYFFSQLSEKSEDLFGVPSSVASHEIHGKSFHLSEPQMPSWEAITSGSIHRL